MSAYTALALLAREVKRAFCDYTIACLIGAGLLLLAAHLYNGWRQPPPASVQLIAWKTARAQVVLNVAIEHSSAPTIVVTMNEFRRQMESLPYTISYWEGWQNDPDAPSFQGTKSILSYLGKKAGSDVYLLARETIPEISGFGYTTKTIFDSKQIVFTAVVTGRSLWWILPAILGAAGLLTFLGVFFFHYEDYKWRYVRLNS